MKKNIQKILAIVLIVFATNIVSACVSKEPEALKSPCVGAKDSPCGSKRSANPSMYKV
jgi:hypothetical protein